MKRPNPLNATHFWRDSKLADLTFMRADFTTHEYPTHFHDGFVVAVTERGGAEIKNRGVRGEAEPGTLLVFNPGDPHSSWMGWSSRWSYRSFYIESSAISEIGRALGLSNLPYLFHCDIRDANLIECFLKLHRAMESSLDLFERHELLIMSFGALLRRHSKGTALPPSISRDHSKFSSVTEVMREQYDQNITLEDLSRIAEVTIFQLIKLFKRTVGVTPHRYLTQLRLNAARRLLERGIPIDQAAIAAGFYDQSALNKSFKRCFGITPGQFICSR